MLIAKGNFMPTATTANFFSAIVVVTWRPAFINTPINKTQIKLYTTLLT